MLLAVGLNDVAFPCIPTIGVHPSQDSPESPAQLGILQGHPHPEELFHEVGLGGEGGIVEVVLTEVDGPLQGIVEVILTVPLLPPHPRGEGDPLHPLLLTPAVECQLPEEALVGMVPRLVLRLLAPP